MAEQETQETKRERSVRIGNARIQKALKAIDLLKALVSANYDINEEELQEISNAVSDAAVALQKAYETGVVSPSGYCLS